MQVVKKIYLLLLVLLGGLSAVAQKSSSFDVKKTKDLGEFFTYKPGRKPLIIAHRGGTAKGLPENCIATFEHTIHITPFFEIDPRLTKDSVIVILHDATLDRTTNGKGNLSDYTWEEVKKLRLKDANGNLTNYGIPTLEETIKWANGKCLLMLDRKNVPIPLMVKKLKEWKASSQVIMSAFELPDAKAYHELDEKLMLEIYIKNKESLDQVVQSGIPMKNIIAYVSQPKTKEFYDLLHSKGLMAIVYTATVLEKEKDEKIRKQSYADIISNGGDIILANDVEEVASVIWPK